MSNKVQELISQFVVNHLDGRAWHRLALSRGYKLRPKMQMGKVYLYQLYTEIFVEFDSHEEVDDFRKYLDKEAPMWDYDPVVTLDTNDPTIAEHWKDSIVFLVEGGNL